MIARLKFYLTVASIAALAFGAIHVILRVPEPPEASLRNARASVDLAAEAGAVRYAEQQYLLAEQVLKNGWMEMARQKGRLPFSRDFAHSDTLLNQAMRFGLKALYDARRRTDYLDSLAEKQLGDLRTELSSARDALDGALLNLDAERYWSFAEVSLSTAEALIRRGEYEEATGALGRGKQLVRKLIEELAETANDEVGKIEVWRRWVKETVASSKANGNYTVIVDKSAHKAYLVHGGRLAKTFDAEVGWNSAHQKLFAGDGATPEGQYRVTQVKRNSKYYRALLLNYPNDLDKRRFGENKRKGVISKSARIGAYIEIHGGGGRNGDWTDGCVALTNHDMDDILRYVGVGTLVTIVRRSDRWP